MVAALGRVKMRPMFTSACGSSSFSGTLDAAVDAITMRAVWGFTHYLVPGSKAAALADA